ncbi:MAG: hypothetical protein ACREHF_12530 [Rhizomicrobium sp.]
MNLGFLPFVMFALLANLSHDLALWAAFAAAFALALHDFAQHRVLRLFETGSLAIFGATAFFTGFLEPGLSAAMTRLIVDLGFCALALLSLAVRNPLTVPEVPERERADNSPRRRVRLRHYALTALWAVDFLLMAAADGFADKHKYLPQSLDGAAGLALLLAGLAATARFAPPAARESARSGALQPGSTESPEMIGISLRSGGPLRR